MQFPNTSPGGAYKRGGDLTDDFLRYKFGGGLIHGGAYFRNFTDKFVSNNVTKSSAISRFGYSD